MSQQIPASPDRTDLDFSSRTVAIVASRFNEEYTDALVESCRAELLSLAPDVGIEVVRVPGSFEVPMGVQIMARSERTYACYIALGVILKGSTAHDMHVGTAVGHALMLSLIHI